ncbi:MAG: leucine-rich repeat domain-containing protein [Clostridia bacterium]|nr:leucine-rich repeat domain-containing protein [Clostridia bacterium]
MKKAMILILTLALALLLAGILPALAATPENLAYTSEDGLYQYKLRPDGVMLYGITVTEADFALPTRIDRKLVTELFYHPQWQIAVEKVTRVTLPRHVSVIGDWDIGLNPFCELTDLEEIAVPEQNDVFEVVDGGLYNRETKTLIAYPAARQETGFTIQEGTERIAHNALMNCAGLNTIALPDSLTAFGVCDVETCSNLRRVEVSDSHPTLKTAGGILFTRDGETLLLYPCGRLNRSYTAPEGTKHIADGAFCGAASLKTLTLPEGVYSIGAGAFEGCAALTRINLPASLMEAYFADNLEDCSPDLTFCVSRGTYAEAYCLDNGLKVAYP